MNTLIAVGTGAAFVFSAVVTVVADWFAARGRRAARVLRGGGRGSSRSCCSGNLLEARAKGRTSGAIRRLIGLRPADGAGPPRRARGRTCRSPTLSSRRRGGRPPRRDDSRRRRGARRRERRGRVDAHRRADAGRRSEPGDRVIGATLNRNGAFRFRVERVGDDTVLARIIRLVQQAQGSQGADPAAGRPRLGGVRAGRALDRHRRRSSSGSTSGPRRRTCTPSWRR